MVRFGAIVLVALVLGLNSDDALETPQQIQACIAANSPRISSIQRVQMRTFDRVGGERSFDAKIYWKRGEGGLSKLLVRVDDPPDLRGAAYLAIERPETVEMFTYLPEIKRVRRIHSRSISGSFLGTDFTYEDLVRLQDMAGRSNLERLPDSDVGGRATYVLAAQPEAAAESSYVRIVAFVDQETCVLLKAEFFGEGGKPIKRLVANGESLTDEGGIWIARTVTMHDLVGGGESQIVVKKIRFDVDIPDREFSHSQLSRHR